MLYTLVVRERYSLERKQMILTKTSINKQLSNGLYIVRYEKRNGEIRTQIATRDMSLIPAKAHPKGANINQSDGIVRFFSILDGGWRSFVIDNLIGISNEVSLVTETGFADLDEDYPRDMFVPVLELTLPVIA